MKGSPKMLNHHFISYSGADAYDFAVKLCDELIAGPPEISAWLDKREIKPGRDWDDQIVKAIRTCYSLIFVMTPDSVESESGCKNEWTRAMKYKKPITPILLHEDAETPFQLENRQHIDFIGDFETALAKLRIHIQWLDSPEGKINALKARLADARRDLRRTEDSVKQIRIQDDIESLKKQIADQEQIVADPEAARKRVEESIATGMERERQPKQPISGVTKTKFINPPPGQAPTYFQDRFHETKLVGKFLENDVERLITIVGRAGVGKTAMVCRLLKSLEGGRLPENGENHNGGNKLKVDGIVYLSERGSRKVNFPDIYYDLCRLLPDDLARDMDSVYRDTTASTSEKMNALLRVFPEGRFIVLLDNFEDKVDTKTLTIKDDDVMEALTALLTSAPHAVKMILTTRIAPKKLTLVEPAKQRRLDLDEGLESPYAENILREMDMDGKVGLKEASDEVLYEARKRTNGFPRALEALFAILSADRDTSLAEVLTDAEKLLPEHVVAEMVGEAYSRLDSEAQMVMQALAIYGRPLSNVAVDYLLQPYTEGIDSAKVLKRLVNMQFVRKEATHYYLHPVDREHALSCIPKGTPDDRIISTHLSKTEIEATSVFSQYGLLDRGAHFYRETRLPREDWKNLNDLAPQLAEIELRLQSQDYDTALGVLLEIDFSYLMLWGHARIAREFHQRLQGKIEDENLKIDSLNNLASCHFSLGDYQKAIEHLQQSLDIARDIGDREGEGANLNNLAICYQDLGDYQRAIEHLQQSLNTNRETDDRLGEEASLGNLGSCHFSLGDYQKAIEHYQQSLDIARDIGDREGEGKSLESLGNCFGSLGDYQKAIEHYQQSLDITRGIGDRRDEGIRLGNLGSFYHSLGDYQKVIEHYQRSYDIAREIGDRRGEGISLHGLGGYFNSLGDYQKAIEHHQQSLNIAREIGYRRGEGNSLGGLGGCYDSLGDYQKAIEHYQQSLDIARDIGDREGEGNSLGGLGGCYDSLGDYQKAIEHYKQSLDIDREIGDRRGQAHSLSNLACSLLFLGDTNLAHVHLNAAAEIWEEMGPPGVVKPHVVLSIALLKSDQYHEAKTNLEKALRQADYFLEQANRVETIDSKALALCGLAVCNHDMINAERAKAAFIQARAITKAKGRVDEVLKFFDLIVEFDDKNLLLGLREVAAGANNS